MTKPTMTGFATYETANYSGFDQANLSQWLRIVESVKKDQKVQFIIGLHGKITEHVADINPHPLDFTIEPYKNLLISDLFAHYRNLGFRGTKEDMLLSIGKDIPIADEDDILAGISRAKAVDNLGWSTIFKKHTNDKLSHPHFLRIYQQDFCCLHTPSVSFLASIPVYDKENGHEFVEWFPKGTVFFTLQYFNPSQTDVLKLYGDVQDIVFSITNTNIKMTRKFHEQDEEDVIFDLPLAYTNSGIEKVAISYDDKMFKMRRLLDETERVFNFRKINSMRIEIPLSEIKTKVSMKEFMYYPAILSDTDIMALMK